MLRCHSQSILFYTIFNPDVDVETKNIDAKHPSAIQNPPYTSLLFTYNLHFMFPKAYTPTPANHSIFPIPKFDPPPHLPKKSSIIAHTKHPEAARAAKNRETGCAWLARRSAQPRRSRPRFPRVIPLICRAARSYGNSAPPAISPGPRN